VYDTKYLARSLPEVFGSETSLSEVYVGLLKGGRRAPPALRRALRPALRPAGGAVGRRMASRHLPPSCGARHGRPPGPAAAHGTAPSGPLRRPPPITHQAPRRAPAAGGKAAQLRQVLGLAEGAPLPLPAVRHAPGCERYARVEAGGLAHEAGYDAFMTGAAFAALAALYRSLGEACPGALPPQEPAGANLLAEGGAAGGAALAAVQPYLGRINVTRSDIPYAAFSGADPEPPRPHIFHVYGLAPLTRVGDIMREFAARGLGRVRVSFADASSAFVETDVDAAGGVLEALRGLALCKVVPYAEYARCKREGLALPGLDVQPGGGGWAAAAAAGGGEERSRKRPRREEADPPAGQERGWCAIM
jgi:hypothetical protein